MVYIIVNTYHISVPNLRSYCAELRAGDKVFLSGYVFTARDAAHKRFSELLDSGHSLPVDLKEAVIYYAGPTPAPDGMPIGSCGPTTSSRMDCFTPRILDLGLCAMIGKGERNGEVKNAIIRNNAVYLCAVGGAGALAASCIKSCEVAAFEDLGCESVKKLYFEDFPLTVASDSHGGDIFISGRSKYRSA